MSLLNQIDKFLEERSRKRSENHYPSEAFDCTRKIYYSRKGVEQSNPADASAIWKMEIGNAIHDRIASIFNDMKLKVLDEVPFKKKIKGLDNPISGRLDNIYYNSEGKQVGVEIKTKYGRGIVELKKNGIPNIEALAQVVIYMNCTDIQEFRLLYIGRDNAYRTEFLFTKEGNDILLDGKTINLTFDDIVKKFQAIEIACKSNEIPERKFTVAIKNCDIKPQGYTKNKKLIKGDWNCSYCSYMEHCWKEVVEKSAGKTMLGEEEI